jgi:hypothetical protein
VIRYGKLNEVNSSANFVAVVVVAGIVVAIVMLASWRGVKSRSANWIVGQLQKSDLPYEIKVGIGGRVWNPSLGQEGTGLFGPGQATYTLDEHDVVHLRFVYRSGPAQDFSGPLPDLGTRGKSRKPST